jgi:hypothetical protein
MNIQAGSTGHALRESQFNSLRKPGSPADSGTDAKTTGPSTTAATGDFAARMLKFLGKSAGATVNEEELFAGLIQDRLEKINGEAAEFYATEKAKLMVSMARSDGYIPLEDVAKEALKAAVAAGKVEDSAAENVNAEAFAAAQLDDNSEALYDGRGSGSDPTIATAGLESALTSMKEFVEKIESGELKLEGRSLSIPSNGSPAADPSPGETGGAGAIDLSGDQALDGSGGFLWKPESERDGNLAVLLPDTLAELVERLEIHTKNPPDESSKIGEGAFSGNTNGNRPTFRFDKPGAEFGDDLWVVAFKKDGETASWKIGNGGERND